MYDLLTDTELAELGDRAYRATVSLFDAAMKRFTELSAQPALLPVHAPDYNQLMREAGIMMAAGREQRQMHHEIMQAVRYRSECALRLTALTLPEDDVALLREFDLIDAAGRRDDPLMREDGPR